MAQDITIITDHEARAFARFFEQWKSKPNMEGVIRSLVGGYPEMETMFFDLMNKTLNIELAEGAQLDVIGEIVGQERLGFADDFYRILIRVRIGINVSEGEPARIISTAKTLTGASFIHYMNLRNGEVAIGTDGTIDVVTKDFLLANLQRVLMGGVRLDYVATYEKDNAFAFSGVNATASAMGFGTIANVNTGGKLAKINTFKNNFSFNGNATGDGGFGTIARFLGHNDFHIGRHPG